MRFGITDLYFEMDRIDRLFQELHDFVNGDDSTSEYVPLCEIKDPIKSFCANYSCRGKDLWSVITVILRKLKNDSRYSWQDVKAAATLMEGER